MEKEEVLKLYNELGENKVDELYYYSCLLSSGFDNDTAYKLIGTLRSIWLEDENDYSISKLSDMLFNVYDEIDDIDDLTDSELLYKMYNNDYSSNDEEGIYYD